MKGKEVTASKLDTIRLLPIGGLGEIGMNLLILSYGKDSFIIDSGVKFPDSSQFGFDLILPDLQVIEENAREIKAIIITHGHEDHIGAVPFIMNIVNSPLYASPFVCELIKEKLKEFDMHHAIGRLNSVSDWSRIDFGAVEFEFLHVTHSIPQSFSLLIRTPIGTIIHTGDFKIEKNPLSGQPFDERPFRKAGDEGVLLLLSDSTNIEVEGQSMSEMEVEASLEDIISKWAGRVIVALFSSNLYRVSSLFRIAAKTGRKVALLGRSVHSYIQAGHNSGIIELPLDEVVDPAFIEEIARGKLLVICTGTQAEKRSVLYRASVEDHEDISIKEGDLVILSSRIIPGNERQIYVMINNLSRLGAKVLYEKIKLVHTSGHACRGELEQMIRLVRPRFFMPVHGEYSFLKAHAEMAGGCGVKETIVAENGDIIEVTPDSISRNDRIHISPYFMDGSAIGDYEDLRIDEKKKIGWNGVVAVRLKLTRGKKKLKGAVDLVPFGFYTNEGRLLKEAGELLKNHIEEMPAGASKETVGELVESTIKSFFKKTIQKKPAVLKFIDEE